MFPNTGFYLDSDGNRKNIIELFTGSVKIITSDHELIHKKKGYSISGIFASVANSATVSYAFKTPTVDSGIFVHLEFKEFQASANKVRVDLYEAPTNAPINGNDLSARNRNRVGTIPTSAMQAVKSGMAIDLTGATLLNSE